MDLLEKFERFAVAFVASGNSREAAVAAGYSARSAGPAGSRLLRDVRVKSAIERHREHLAAVGQAPLAGLLQQDDPLAFLMHVVNDARTPVKIRVSAAIAALPFQHKKPGADGKKIAARVTAAEISRSGKFRPTAPPLRLVAGVRPGMDPQRATAQTEYLKNKPEAAVAHGPQAKKQTDRQ